MARPRLHRVSRPADWNLMMAPARFELLEAMRSLAPCSVRELALALDRPADSIYPHLRPLVRIGIVLDRGERPGRTRPERVYDLAADDFRPDFKGTPAKVTGAVVDRSMKTMAGIVARTSRRAAAAGRLEFGPGVQNVVGKVEHAWLTPAEFAAVRERLVSLKRYLDARKTRRPGELYMVAFFAMPVVRSRGARVGGAASSVPATRKRRSGGGKS
jgi:DNA-binding transcriptional ArsR family regulator